jgi:hypothetical protein
MKVFGWIIILIALLIGGMILVKKIQENPKSLDDVTDILDSAGEKAKNMIDLPGLAKDKLNDIAGDQQKKYDDMMEIE